MCRFYPGDYSVSERRGEMIERADSTISALLKMVECKQLMPDKTVVIFFSSVIGGALRHHYAGLKFLLLQLCQSPFYFPHQFCSRISFWHLAITGFPF